MDTTLIFTKGYWFRYTGAVQQTFENKTSKFSLGGRSVYALYLDKKDKLRLVPQDLTDTYPIDRGQADLLIKSSKPFTGKIETKTIQPGSADFDTTFGTKPEQVEEAKPELVLPKISGAASIKIEALSSSVMSNGGALLPPSNSVYALIEKSLTLLGTKVKFKKTVLIAVSSTVSTCLLGRRNPRKGRYDVYIVLNLGQLSGIFGTPLSPKDLAQVITHELAHYTMNHGIMKQSDLMKFKKLIAAKQMHKDQFNHPGYGYPWWHEAWAILCEAMVHGNSARGFTTPLGYEIAEKYFVNRYLPKGEYKGTYASS
jgi:hypothetical protein